MRKDTRTTTARQRGSAAMLDKPLVNAIALLTDDLGRVISSFGIHLRMNRISTEVPDGHPLGHALVDFYRAVEVLKTQVNEQGPTCWEDR